MLLCALALAACGSGSGDDGEVEASIETATSSTDPSKCTEVETQAFMEQRTHVWDAGAVQRCEKEAKEGTGVADSVEVSNVEVKGTGATAEAALTGGTFDGQTVVVSLVEEDGRWKVNELTRFAKFDHDKLVAAYESQLSRPSLEAPKSFVSCVVETLDEFSQKEIEDLFWVRSSESFEHLSQECS